MPIPFTCPYCGHQTNVADQYAGQSGPCLACGETVTIPTVFSGPAPPPPRRSSSGPTMGLIVAVLLVVFLVCGGVLIALLLPAVQAAREAARRSQCTNNLKQIGLALHNYHDVYKCFPGAILTDDEGEPWRSWRVAVLPFIEQTPIYDQYDFDEPWNGPNNATLEFARPATYVCPSSPPTSVLETNYVMIIGKGTVGGEPNEFVKMSDILDGTSNTIMAIEVRGSGMSWMEPRDMTVDEAIAYIANPAGLAHPGGVNVLMTDGSVHFVPSSTNQATLRALMTRDDGQNVSLY